MICKGNQVKFACFVLLAVSEKQKHDFNFFFAQCIIKQLLDSVFVISRIVKVSVIRLSAEAAYLYLDYSGYHKNLIQ